MREAAERTLWSRSAERARQSGLAVKGPSDWTQRTGWLTDDQESADKAAMG